MSKLFVYMHKGKGGCGKPAFYLTERPQPGSSLHSDTFITVDAELPNTLKNLNCGACGKPVPLTTIFLKPATTHQLTNLLDKAMSRQAATQASAESLYDNLWLLHELLTKVRPQDQQQLYKGSALEASVIQLLGLDKLDIDLVEDKQLVDTNGKTLSQELDHMNEVLEKQDHE